MLLAIVRPKRIHLTNTVYRLRPVDTIKSTLSTFDIDMAVVMTEYNNIETIMELHIRQKPC